MTQGPRTGNKEKAYKKVTKEARNKETYLIAQLIFY